jgi:hypothetical protein
MEVSMEKSVDELLLEKIEIVIRLLALQIASDRSVTEGAQALKLAGIDNKTIAKVLNTTDATVRTLTSGARGRRKG